MYRLLIVDNHQLLTAVIAISVVSRSALTMEMSFFYCVLSASGLHHPVDDGRQAADLTGLPAQVVGHGSFFAHHEVRFHLAFALDRDRAPELGLVTAVHQDLSTENNVSIITCTLQWYV